MKKIVPIFIVILVLVAGGSFYGGMVYGKSSGRGNFRNFANLTPEQRQLGMRDPEASDSQGGFTGGDIIAKDDRSITIKLRDGGSKIVFYSTATEITKFASGTAADLEIGKTISVTGTANSDGSITATSFQLRPAIINPVANQD